MALLRSLVPFEIPELQRCHASGVEKLHQACCDFSYHQRHLGVRREAKRRFRTHENLQFQQNLTRPKALSPLRSASALHDTFRVVRALRGFGKIDHQFRPG